MAYNRHTTAVSTSNKCKGTFGSKNTFEQRQDLLVRLITTFIWKKCINIDDQAEHKNELGEDDEGLI